MSEVLQKHVCEAVYAFDMVGLKFGPQRFLLYYQTAFKMAAGILMSAKLAARYEGVHPSKWTEFVNNAQQAPFEPLSHEYRRTMHTPNFKTWKVGFESNLVTITFDHETIKMHYSDAFTLYGMIRVASKNAKRWAGDTGKQWTTRACLTDAEENDKFVYAH